MNTHPADIPAHTRADTSMGLSRELQQARIRESDPSRGGSCGYDIHDCEWVLEQAAQCHPVQVLMRSLGH
jgi:hypothetical protein